MDISFIIRNRKIGHFLPHMKCFHNLFFLNYKTNRRTNDQKEKVDFTLKLAKLYPEIPILLTTQIPTLF